VLGGWSAAELLGAGCARRDAPAEVVVLSRQRALPDLLVRHDNLSPDEIVRVDGIPVTSPVRTAFDLERRPPLVDAVVAIDALARVCRIAPADVLRLADVLPGTRGVRQLPDVVRLADPRAESPMETRLRLAIVEVGLVPPVVQHPVGPYVLDLAYPGIRLGIEYNGSDHLTQERAHRDLVREAYLSRAGWEMLRFGAADVLRHPRRVAAAVRERLLVAARGRGLMLHELDPR
jgi:very-short-patch-repair endonuclease